MRDKYSVEKRLTSVGRENQHYLHQTKYSNLILVFGGVKGFVFLKNRNIWKTTRVWHYNTA